MIYLQQAGTGETPVVLIHAFPLTSQMWDPQFNELLRHTRVVTVDLPGFGSSPVQTDFSIEDMARELFAALIKADIQGPYIVGGLSMGGYVALEFARQFPSSIKALGLFSTRAGADTPEAREKRLRNVEAIQKDGLEEFAKKTMPYLLGKTALENNDLTGLVETMILGNKCEGVTNALQAMAGRRDSTFLLPDIRCPTLILAGREDNLIPVSEAEEMNRKIPGSTLHVIPGAGHLINMEQPQTFNRLLVDFASPFFGPVQHASK